LGKTHQKHEWEKTIFWRTKRVVGIVSVDFRFQKNDVSRYFWFWKIAVSAYFWFSKNSRKSVYLVWGN